MTLVNGFTSICALISCINSHTYADAVAKFWIVTTVSFSRVKRADSCAYCANGWICKLSYNRRRSDIYSLHFPSKLQFNKIKYPQYPKGLGN